MNRTLKCGRLKILISIGSDLGFSFALVSLFAFFWVNNHNISFLAIRDIERGPKVAGIDWLRVPLLDADQTYIVGLIWGSVFFLLDWVKRFELPSFNSFCLYFLYLASFGLLVTYTKRPISFPLLSRYWHFRRGWMVRLSRPRVWLFGEETKPVPCLVSVSPGLSGSSRRKLSLYF